jgi:hypothetical protein
VDDQLLQERDHERDRDEQEADADEEWKSSAVHASRGREDLAPSAPACKAERCGRSPGRPGEAEHNEDGEAREHEAERERVLDQPDQCGRPARDDAAEEAGRRRTEQRAARDGVAALAPAFRPADRLGPLALQVGAGRPVEEGGPQLPPAAVEADPRKSGPSLRRLARDRPQNRANVERRRPRIVTPDPLLRRAAQVEPFAEEVRMRSGRRVHHRMRGAEALELAVLPVGPLRALVLAVADLDRGTLQRLRGGRRVEDELDHLPVALVQVVPVVEDVEEPVLQRELVGESGLLRDMCVRHRAAPGCQPPFPIEIRATGIERTTGKVEVVVVQARRQILRRRPDLDEVVAAPRSSQRDRRLAEQQVDVDRQVRLARGARRVLDEPQDGGVALGKCRLLRQVGRGAGCGHERAE